MVITGAAEQWNRGLFFVLRTLMHFIGAAHFWYAIYYDLVFVKPPVGHVAYNRMGGFAGKFKYLTFLNAIIQAFYFSICLYNDFFGTNEVAPKKPCAVRKFRDYLLAAFAFPLAMNVGISFWALMAIDRELILPKSFDEFFPSWLNHVMHSNIVVFITLEICTTFRKYPSRKAGLTGLTIFMFAYLIWIHVIKHVSGQWVYPVLDVLEFPQRIVFFIVISVFGLSFYFLGEYFNNTVWATELKTLKSSGGGGGKKHK